MLAEPASLMGGCLCGAVRYRCDSEIHFASLCYCGDCRHWSGSGSMPVVGVRRDALTVNKGQTRQFSSTGGSGQPTVRHFCETCGSSLFGWPGALPAVATINAGTLDNPDLFHPQVAVCVAGRPGWSRLAIDCAEFDFMPG